MRAAIIAWLVVCTGCTTITRAAVESPAYSVEPERVLDAAERAGRRLGMNAERANGALRLTDAPLNLAEDELTVTAEPERLYISAAIRGDADSEWLAPTASVLGRATEQILEPSSASGELVRSRWLPAVVALDVVAPWAGTLYGDLGNPWSDPSAHSLAPGVAVHCTRCPGHLLPAHGRPGRGDRLLPDDRSRIPARLPHRGPDDRRPGGAAPQRARRVGVPFLGAPTSRRGIAST